MGYLSSEIQFKQKASSPLGYNLKALHYCGTHPNSFLVQNCKHCGQGMCNACISKHSDFCPECQIEIGLGGGYKNIKREVLLMTLFGLMVGAMYIGFLYIEYPEVPFAYPQNWFVLLAFALGVSLVGSYFMLRNWSFYQEAQRLPFIGLKATFFIPIITAATLVPFFYFLYHLISLLWQTAIGKKADT
jgi:putative flippase GtrA